MGNEYGAMLADFCALYFDAHFGHAHPHELGDGMLGYVEGKERGHGRLYGMPQRGYPVVLVGLGETACGYQYFVGIVAAAVGKLYGEALRLLLYLFYGFVVAHLHALAHHLLPQAFDDRLRVVGNREHSAVGFCL